MPTITQLTDRPGITPCGHATTFLVASVLAVLLGTVCAPGAAAQCPLVLTDATLVDVEHGQLLPGQTVVLVDGRIERLGPDGEVPVPSDGEVVPCEGRFVIPGLWDMHVHDIERTETLPLYLAHGVTGVRAMGGDATACIEARDRVARGELIGPRIVTSGPFLDGRSSGQERWQLDTADQARDAVLRLSVLRADFAKVHETLSREAFDGVVEGAGKLGLPVAGHVPRSLRYEDAVSAGMASIEHVNQLAERLLTSGSMASDEALDAEVQALLAGRGAELFAAMVEQGTAFTPTLVAHEGILRGANPDSGVWDDERLAWLPPAMAEDWRISLPVFLLPEGFVRERRFVQRASRALVRGLHESGVVLLAGSDVGAPHVYPGASLHDELERLAACGLNPLEALRTATTAPAVFLHWEDQLGSIAPGRAADLVLLDGNPLEDIANVRRVHAVITRGMLLDREALDGLLSRPEVEAATEESVGR